MKNIVNVSSKVNIYDEVKWFILFDVNAMYIWFDNIWSDFRSSRMLTHTDLNTYTYILNSKFNMIFTRFDVVESL